jgi:sRNA-binding carbon storage regulator CsrA
MLILNRSLSERVIIRNAGTGEIIEVKLVGILSGGKVRLGFTAPPNYSVDRPEIAAAKARGPGCPVHPPMGNASSSEGRQ